MAWQPLILHGLLLVLLPLLQNFVAVLFGARNVGPDHRIHRLKLFAEAVKAVH
ncbi:MULTISPECIES: hypothetical protein [unclassified Bradyrhizobium]|uniref:hypothetical protein n=1 Tax=unclassified Bradyrhizobium TaxID=2631580 RepID=UPI001FFA279B|nr:MULTISPECIES: hypothetical protein [unclassified Bradyrhizobium]MCK1716012.1 hypothetical protein [Bradyrhizobium sp. 143]MCK1728035.1 hypothetical protein [Bradyrhizobium sp. 142]